jgi:hypothetical protein
LLEVIQECGGFDDTIPAKAQEVFIGNLPILGGIFSQDCEQADLLGSKLFGHGSISCVDRGSIRGFYWIVKGFLSNLLDISKPTPWILRFSNPPHISGRSRVDLNISPGMGKVNADGVGVHVFSSLLIRA